ncbi:class II aldolase/adducin family protein [Gammaproteobacteria bacterium]|jgi:ribulose-5-phosphate 4-epimerase/fuculose-1-phosphate aldolase|nr:class II aldolase/adducin family protein [Gammaproteobacteria bacterium]
MASNSAVQHTISPEEWALRQDLAACYRLFVKYGWTDLIFTHLSARVPGEPYHYLINPYGLLFQEITASNLIKVDFSGNVVSGDYPYNEAGHAIHSAVLKARPDINVALHSHTRAGTAVSAMECGLLSLSQQANEIGNLVCYHRYDVATDNDNECARLGEDLANKWAMIMHNHGLLSVGRDMAEAFYLLYTLENACKIQVDVMASGAEQIIPNRNAITNVEQFSLVGKPNAGDPDGYLQRNWQALIRMLDREDQSFRQ